MAAGGVNDIVARLTGKKIGLRAARPAIIIEDARRAWQQPRHWAGRAGKSRCYYPAGSFDIESVERDDYQNSSSLSSVTSHRSRVGEDYNVLVSIRIPEKPFRPSPMPRPYPGDSKNGVGRSGSSPPFTASFQGDDRRRHGDCALSRRMALRYPELHR